jgi:hypothetical protein
MLVLRTTEDPTDPVGELVSAKQTVGLDHLALAVVHFGSMAFSHGLRLGGGQLTILTPVPLFSASPLSHLGGHL